MASEMSRFDAHVDKQVNARMRSHANVPTLMTSNLFQSHFLVSGITCVVHFDFWKTQKHFTQPTVFPRIVDPSCWQCNMCIIGKRSRIHSSLNSRYRKSFWPCREKHFLCIWNNQQNHNNTIWVDCWIVAIAIWHLLSDEEIDGVLALSRSRSKVSLTTHNMNMKQIVCVDSAKAPLPFEKFEVPINDLAFLVVDNMILFWTKNNNILV